MRKQALLGEGGWEINHLGDRITNSKCKDNTVLEGRCR